MDLGLEREEVDYIEEEFLKDLMEEPPHGHNHGRERGVGGGWHPLETDPRDVPSFKRYVERPHTHGTIYSYVKLRCRCVQCKAAWNAYQREWRRMKPQ